MAHRTIAMAAASSALLGTGIFMHSSNSRSTRMQPSVKLIAAEPIKLPIASILYGRSPAFAEYKPLVTKASGAQNVLEPSTGFEFPKIQKLPGASSSLTLLGVGVREKKIAFVSVKVYSVAFYVNEEQLSKDSSKNLSEGEFEKGLVLKLARDIDGALFCSALDEELKPRMNGGDEMLAEFRNIFSKRSLKKGTSVYFTWIQPATLHVAISEDNMVPSNTTKLETKLLASALFSVYLGDKPVSPTLKASVSNSIQQVYG